MHLLLLYTMPVFMGEREEKYSSLMHLQNAQAFVLYCDLRAALHILNTKNTQVLPLLKQSYLGLEENQ